MSFAFLHSQICNLGPWGRKQYYVSTFTAWVSWLILRLGPPMFQNLWIRVPEQMEDRRAIENHIQREWDARTSKEQVQIEREAGMEFHKVMQRKWNAAGPRWLFEKDYVAELEKRRAQGRPDNEYEPSARVSFIVHTFTLLEPPVELNSVIENRYTPLHTHNVAPFPSSCSISSYHHLPSNGRRLSTQDRFAGLGLTLIAKTTPDKTSDRTYRSKQARRREGRRANGGDIRLTWTPS